MARVPRLLVYTGLKKSKEKVNLFQKALRENQALTNAILNSLTAGIPVVDKGGNIVAVNAAWKRFVQFHAICVWRWITVLKKIVLAGAIFVL